ncbi:hypothetical protein I3843_08G030900 [Carya illinoinensis]|uniref:Uncharacterized protein n=1 Tax=Carya illinoinensis TaxID=32201 RepID=A0A922EAJ6_CARIL|nr:hypothetical protein I3842_08G031200 [Carya illinoinensis]KAG7966043.1 hypothetical protein I3843_08G030900 [Carya illinoinensis]
MGFETLEEIRPVTPIRTISITRSFNHAMELSSPDERKYQLLYHEECHTPKISDQALKSPLVCPPAPKKPRTAKRKLRPPPKRFLEVPQDLASVFMVLNKPSKKIRAS